MTSTAALVEETIMKKRLRCDKHPVTEIESEVVAGHQIKSCPECEKERAQEEDKRRIKREEQEKFEKQKTINKALDNAMLAPRFRQKTLKDFQIDNEGQSKAVASIKWFIKEFPERMGLILIGRPGTGKNHLACACVRQLIEEGKTGLITTVSKVLRKIKDSWRAEGKSETEIMRSFLKPDILVIDEIGVQFGSDTERMYITEIINDRYEWEKPTILISNLTMKELSGLLGDRVIDRFREGGKVVVFDWESYRGMKQKNIKEVKNG